MNIGFLNSLLKKNILFVLLFFCQAYAVSVEIKLKTSQKFKQIEAQKIEKSFIFFVTDAGLDSINWETVQEIRIKKKQGLHPLTKTAFYCGYFSLFYFLLESMYKEAPFSIPQFFGVFSVFTGSGALGGYIYTILPEQKKNEYHHIKINNKKINEEQIFNLLQAIDSPQTL